MNVLDLFCGCGGLSYGFQLSGHYSIVGGVDFNSDAIKTFKANFPSSQAICGDLSQMDETFISQHFGQVGGIDVLVGGPPCQGFSSANRYKKGDDARNNLFYEFVKFVDLAQPKIIVIENVRGIITENNGYAKDQIYKIFTDRDYWVNHQLLNAADYGVPQNRIRNFFVMLKKDAFSKPFDFSLLKKQERVSVKDALSDLYSLEQTKSHIKDDGRYKILDAPSSEYQKYLRNSQNEIESHHIYYPNESIQKRLEYVKQGENWKSIPTELFPSNRNNRHSSAYKRLDENAPSITIDTGNAHSNYFHPIYHRIPTVREAARLQSFNDRFSFQGSKSSQYKQVGNAVPPLLAKAIADALAKH